MGRSFFKKWAANQMIYFKKHVTDLLLLRTKNHILKKETLLKKKTLLKNETSDECAYTYVAALVKLLRECLPSKTHSQQLARALARWSDTTKVSGTEA